MYGAQDPSKGDRTTLRSSRGASLERGGDGIRPSVAVGAAACVLVAIIVLVTHFRGESAAVPDRSSEASAAATSRRVGRADEGTGSRTSGWVAQSETGGHPPAAGGAAGPRRVPAGGGVAAGAEPGVGAGGAGADALHAGGRVPASNPAPHVVGTAFDTADAAPSASGTNRAPQNGIAVPAGIGAQGGRPAAGAGGAPSVAGSQAPASQAAPADPQQAAQPVTLTQPPGGSTLVYQNAANKDLPLDQVLHVDAPTVLGNDTGAVSFFIQPQWEASDQTNATLVQLGDSATNASGFAITKEGQSLHFTFADDSGATPLDVSFAIDGWKPGEQHLVSAAWGQSQDNGHSVASFYVDGQLIGQQEYSGHVDSGPGVPLNIGSGYGDPTQTVPGVLTNFKVFNQAPSSHLLGTVPAAGGTAK